MAFQMIPQDGMTRREVLLSILTAGCFILFGIPITKRFLGYRRPTEIFIGKAGSYSEDIGSLIENGMHELKILPVSVKGKTILLKPNLVESHTGSDHIHTHPLVIRGAIEAFLGLGARQVIVAEGTGHCRDGLRVYEESGLAEVLVEDRIPFVDLNYDDVYSTPNAGRHTGLKSLTLPETLRRVDWIVSVPKMKTHHWAGITASMKNMFGVMPGSYYGWPKNVLHKVGIERAILDINTTIKPHFAIVDGIVGMEGDGPIMGTPVYAGVMVMGRNLTAVDVTCARIMGVAPKKVTYLKWASRYLGPIAQKYIHQRGEFISSVKTQFKLIKNIPAQKRLIG